MSAANEDPRPRCGKCYMSAAIDCAGWCTRCYYAAIAHLSAKQIVLLCRAVDATPLVGMVSIELARHELAAARGLEQRGLARTYRPEKRTSFRSRPTYVPGSSRSLTLTPVGRAFIETMAPEQRARYAARRVEPVELEEAIALLRQLARCVIDSPELGHDRFLLNLARGALERLGGESDREVES